MPALTLFTAPKPFTDAHIRVIQRNALAAWTRLPDVEALLVGDEPGMAETAREFGLRHLPNVARNESGTPLVSSIFTLAREAGNSPLLAYVNADILLMPDFAAAAQKMAAQAARFLLVGQRWDLDVTAPLDFSAGWQDRLRSTIHGQGRLHPPAGSDYFVFPRNCFTEVPDFAIGRAGWDNWMIYEARRQRWPVVDATHDVTVIHQSHDYRHLPGGVPHYKLPESDVNIRLAGGREMTRFTLLDTDRRLVDGRLRPRRWSGGSLRRFVESYPLLAWNNYALTERITVLFQRLRAKVAASKQG
jgi:hypothetical protein